MHGRSMMIRMEENSVYREYETSKSPLPHQQETLTIVKSVANRFWALVLSDQTAHDAEESWEEVRDTGLPPTN